MKTIYFLFCSIFVMLFFGCKPQDPNKQIDEGKVKGEMYESKEIGWTIEIPKGFNIVSKDETEARDKKGKEAIESSSNIKVDDSGLKHLIAFQKNQFNLFQSMSEPFTEDKPGAYEEKGAFVNKMIFDAYVGKGIKADTSSGKETISGLEFNAFYAKIYSPEGKVILNQILYSRLINGHDFSVNINYNNDNDKNELVTAFKKSTFKQ